MVTRLPVCDRAEPDDRALLDALPLALLLLGADDRILFANAAAENLFGLAEEALQQSTLAALFGPGPPLADILARIRAGQGTVIAREIRPSGLLQGETVDIRASSVADRERHVLLAIEARRLAAVFRGQNALEGAMRSAHGLAAMLAHEIRNPLSGIRGAAQIVARSADRRVHKMANLIRDEVDRIRRLIDRLEDFSDDRPFERAPVNIHDVLGHVRAVACAGFASGHEVREIYDPSLPMVLGDRDRLIQIFLNLVKNAAEAMGERPGTIRLETAWRQGVRLPRSDGGTLLLPIAVTIADSGPGIPPALVDHVFDPFVTGRDGGSGLGLAMVAKLVAAHDGLVELETGTEGTAFHVLLPAAREEAPR